ncbi:hypothetical protein [Prescottella agglutinans]|uniref:Uncharacterized protein n=1 Tax=Prescottella agglutinans TaxID=1644129 RepID=A0ABT6ML81_9NOCA|nr:hypothetical protein [Prescottella agglutinans]MDH6284624.1 hypothetical protein [Prescottella agglutinans]
MTTATRTRSEQRTEFLTDILTTAIEGGVSYWARALAYQHTEAPRAVLVRTEDLVFDDNRFAWVPGDGAEQLIVDLDVVARGLNRIASAGADEIKYLPESHRLLVTAANRENDMMPADARYGDIDAGVADTIVQVALFGEVVYG